MKTLLAATTALVGIASIALAGSLPAREASSSYYDLDANQRFLCEYGGSNMRSRECRGNPNEGGGVDNRAGAAGAKSARIEKVVYSFCPGGSPCTDGANPEAGLLNVDGSLYGTTYYGGSNSCAYHCTSGSGCSYVPCGTVFSLSPRTGAEKVVYSFNQDGFAPDAGLISASGTLYGTTEFGGDLTYTRGAGTAFAFDPADGSETLLFSFNRAQGRYPKGGMIKLGSLLYGTTSTFGGRYHDGTVFSLDPVTRTETVLHHFSSRIRGGTDGLGPVGNLILVHGRLYGVTGAGGAYRYGTVFSVDPASGHEKVVYSFCSQENCTDGAGPAGGLIDVNGTLYGATAVGGAYEGGTVFALNPDTGAEIVLYSFCSQENCTDGDGPVASLIHVRGKLYGTTQGGGAYGGGTVFSLDPTTGTETALYSFCSQENCADGANPEAALIDVKGTLYGTTYWGGAYGEGTVFTLDAR